jgi:hypothetical protein
LPGMLLGCHGRMRHHQGHKWRGAGMLDEPPPQQFNCLLPIYRILSRGVQP